MVHSAWLGALLVVLVLGGCLGADTPDQDHGVDASDEDRGMDAPDQGNRVDRPHKDDETGSADAQTPPDCRIDAWDFICTTRANPNGSPSQTEVEVSVNPTDPANVFVASKDMDPLGSDDCVWSIGQVTTDGGRTWNTTYVGGTLEERMDPMHPLHGWECVTDPILTYDEDGVLYYVLQIYMKNWLTERDRENTCAHLTLEAAPTAPGCTSAMLLAASHDGGRSFPVENIQTMTYTTGAVTYHDYPRMIVNPATGTVTTAWNAQIGTYVSSTRNQGESVDEPAFIPGFFFDTGLTATSDGKVYAVVNQGREEMTHRFLAVSTDDARSFIAQPLLLEIHPSDCTPDERSEYRCGKGGVELAADASGGEYDGRLYAVWPDGRDDPADVMVAWSDDEGLSWSDPVKVNQDATDHVQWLPRVDVDHDGTVHVVYLDRSYDEKDRFYDATYAWSTDGGATWQTQRVSQTLSDGNLGRHQDGGAFIGDYIGVDVAQGHVYLGYPTTERGLAEISVSHLIHNVAS